MFKCTQKKLGLIYAKGESGSFEILVVMLLTLIVIAPIKKRDMYTENVNFYTDTLVVITSKLILLLLMAHFGTWNQKSKQSKMVY